MNNISVIYNLDQNKNFSYQEALDLIPLFTNISRKTKIELNLYNSQLSFHKENSARFLEIQEKVNNVLKNWSEKIKRLGGIPVSINKVKIPSAQGFYYWEYPQKDLILS